MALLETGFPEKPEDIATGFNLLSATAASNVLQVALQPKSPGARRNVPQIRLGLETTAWALVWTEMHFADGSMLRNDFFNSRTNVAMEASLMAPPVNPDFKLIHPMAK
jgi:hypothetical protein